MNFDNKIIKENLVNEIVRLKYSLSDNLTEKIIKKFKKKFKIKIEQNELLKFIDYINDIYNYMSKNLIKYILPSTTGFADPKFIKIDDFKKKINLKYKNEEHEILDIILNAVIYFEYLR